ncbi:MAG: TetR/AcrR family transcriptional regulator [Myxococcales bacterium]|nr:TetR/AcrR family transcriptional regulator [Myxococcota bacterium]MDW8280311.1 TetR/AcrR family transcriptional regulator [Myxococcales bacterium]
MHRGNATRQTILEQAMRMSSLYGLEGVTIGGLAAALSMSKSGLFSHFGSKESLQVEILRAAAQRFTQQVVAPALAGPPGEPRVRALFEGWLDWSRGLPGGCLFVAAAVDMDDRPGPARETLVLVQREWLGVLADAARSAIEEGHFRPDLDPAQFAFEAYALLLGCHHYNRLLHDPRALERTHNAFEALLYAAR